ncbi:MAG TPA: pitrilysin family protein [Candidatus Acidoferrales bacterium]|nr:pitrilysin family protein [Candidatus Acidoferrales bacterium]
MIKRNSELARTLRLSLWPGRLVKGRGKQRPYAVAVAIVALVCASQVRAQGNKGTDVSKVVRLNRAPVSKEVLHVQLPRPTVQKLPNGLTLVLLEDHKLPTVAFTMMIRPGQLADPDDLPGLASFTAAMLREGTTTQTSAQIAKEIDSLGASLGANAGFGSGYLSVNASGLAPDADKILDLMSDVVLHPTFPDSELAQYKQREQSALEQRLSNPGFLANQALRKALYVEPPLSVDSPTKDSIAKVTSADLKKFHDQHFTPGNAIVGVTGDFKTADMRALIEKSFGSWSGAAEAPLALPESRVSEPSKIILVDRPSSVQTYIVAGARTIRRTDPDYYSLVVMNDVLGGGPQARLFLDLREEHSYTYGAYSNMSANIYPGDWTGYAAVRTPVTDGSMTQFVYEYKKIASEAVPASELDDVHRSIIASFALSLEQPAQVLGSWMTVQYYGLAVDYWDKYPDRISGIDAAAVQAAAKKYVDLTHIQWVAVGDRKQIEPVLKKYGSVTVVDADGNPEP